MLSASAPVIGEQQLSQKPLQHMKLSVRPGSLTLPQPKWKLRPQGKGLP